MRLRLQRLQIKFAWYHLWLGAFIQTDPWEFGHGVHPFRLITIYICLVPTVPLVWTLRWIAKPTCVCAAPPYEADKHWYDCPEHGRMCNCW